MTIPLTVTELLLSDQRMMPTALLEALVEVLR